MKPAVEHDTLSATSKLQLRRAHCAADHQAILSHAKFHLHFVVATVEHEGCVELLDEAVQFLEASAASPKSPSLVQSAKSRAYR
jgi:hypothetical protein